MIRICSWCDKIIETIIGQAGIKESICPDCKAKVLDNDFMYDYQEKTFVLKDEERIIN
jgi:DNA-directed RNA polymerase subunit RPC12/RpoP